MQSQKSQNRKNSTLLGCAIVLAILCVASISCHRQPPKLSNLQDENLVAANTVLTKVGKFAEDSFYACLLNGYAQGLSPTEARDECATKLLEDDQKGFGGSPGNLRPGSESFFDPSKITAACTLGDPTRSAPPADQMKTDPNPSWGSYSWGNGYYIVDKHGTWASKGLTEDESRIEKEKGFAAFKVASTEMTDAEDEMFRAQRDLKTAEASGDAKKIKVAKENLATKTADFNSKKAASEKAEEKAKHDPNAGPTSSGGREPSACDQALESARELLRECNRTEWKDFRCQQLQAKVNGCPDPALILVDPEQGYVCGAKIDPEAVKKAWVSQCEQRVKVAPDTANPCAPPTFGGSARFGQGKVRDICGNPYVQTDPNNDNCSTVTIGEQFGQINIHQVIVVALNKLGGPIVVIPRYPKPPHPGTDPRPGPRPN